MAMMTLPAHTRHARRLYVGGIPPNYVSDNDFKDFLNSVVSRGLNEENDSTHVVNVYINQKKCFAFVEFKSIELATTCLQLDGLIFKKVILKVLRANEYKPETVHPNVVNKVLSIDLSSFAFGNPAPSNYGNSLEAQDITDLRLDTCVELSNLNEVDFNSISLVGFPYDEKSSVINKNFGVSSAPKYLRNSLKLFRFFLFFYCYFVYLCY
jgi:RNA recognition motif-containing protein